MSGVHKLSCANCSVCYIGEPSHQLDIKVDKHTEAYDSNPNMRSTAFAEQLLNCEHRTEELLIISRTITGRGQLLKI